MDWNEFKGTIDTVTDMMGEHEPFDMTWDVLLTKIELLDNKLQRLGEHVDEHVDRITEKLHA